MSNGCKSRGWLLLFKQFAHFYFHLWFNCDEIKLNWCDNQIKSWNIPFKKLFTDFKCLWYCRSALSWLLNWVCFALQFSDLTLFGGHYAASLNKSIENSGFYLILHTQFYINGGPSDCAKSVCRHGERGPLSAWAELYYVNKIVLTKLPIYNDFFLPQIVFEYWASLSIAFRYWERKVNYGSYFIQKCLSDFYQHFMTIIIFWRKKFNRGKNEKENKSAPISLITRPSPWLGSCDK